MILTDDLKKEEREEYWSLVMEEFRESGLCKTEYCKNNEIPYSTFRYWERRLSESADALDDGRFTELILPDQKDVKHLSLPLQEDPFRVEMILEYMGIKLLINSKTPLMLISEILGELANAS